MIAHIYPSVLQAGTGAGSNGEPGGLILRVSGVGMQDLVSERPRTLIPRTPVA